MKLRQFATDILGRSATTKFVGSIIAGCSKVVQEAVNITL